MKKVKETTTQSAARARAIRQMNAERASCKRTFQLRFTRRRPAAWVLPVVMATPITLTMVAVLLVGGHNG